MLRSFVQNTSFSPEQVTVLIEAYEKARSTLGLVTRDDPVTEALARKIIQVGARGPIDGADTLCEQALAELRADGSARHG